MSQVTGFYCHGCPGQRPHRLAVVTHPDGRRTRVRVCQTCGERAQLAVGEQPGLCCPKCFHVGLRCYQTRHYPGKTVRLRACRHCGHRLRTAERYEALAATPAKPAA